MLDQSTIDHDDPKYQIVKVSLRQYLLSDSIVVEIMEGKGTASCLMSQVLMAPASGLVLPLHNRDDNMSCTVTVRYQNDLSLSREVTLYLSVTNLQALNLIYPFIVALRPKDKYVSSKEVQDVPEDEWILATKLQATGEKGLRTLFGPCDISMY